MSSFDLAGPLALAHSVLLCITEYYCIFLVEEPPPWDDLGAMLEPFWAVLGPSWGYFGAILGHLGAILGHLGAILGALGRVQGGVLGASTGLWKRS